jgi:hypothetical protein
MEDIGVALNLVWEFLTAGDLWRGPRCVNQQLHRSVQMVRATGNSWTFICK